MKAAGGFIDVHDVHGDKWLLNVAQIRAVIPSPDQKSVTIKLAGGGELSVDCSYKWVVASIKDAGYLVISS